MASPFYDVEIDLNSMSMGQLKIDGKWVEFTRLEIICEPGSPVRVTAEVLAGKLTGKAAGAQVVFANTPTNDSGEFRSFRSPPASAPRPQSPCPASTAPE